MRPLRASLMLNFVLFGFPQAVPQAAVAATVTNQGSYCILVVEEDRGQLTILKPDGSRVGAVKIGERPHEVEVTPDWSTAYVSQFGIADYDHKIGTPGTRVVQVSLKSAKIVGDFTMPGGSRGPHGLKLRPHSQELFVNTEVGGDRMFVFDTRTRTVKRSFAVPAGTHNFIFTDDGRWLISFAGKGGVSKIEARSGKIFRTEDLGSPIRGLAFAKNGDVLASARGELIILDRQTLDVKLRLTAPVHGQLLYLQQLANGELAAPAMDDQGVVFFSGRTTRFVPTGKGALFVRQAPDGLIYVPNIDDTYVSVLNASGTLRRKITGLLTPNGIAFSRCPRSS